MKLLKSTITLFMLFLAMQSSVYAQNSEYQIWKKQAVNELNTGSDAFAYRNWSQSTRTLAAKRLKAVEVYLDAHPNDPVLWYIRGELTNRLIYFYITDIRSSGKKPSANDPKYQALIKEYQSYYRKGLELDDSPDASDHLTLDMLMRISDDVLGAPEIKEKSLQKEMALAQSGGFVSENPNYEWETYEVMLENYIQQQDYDNYLKTVNEMIERFPDSSQMDSLLEAKRQAEEAIKQRDNEAAAAQDSYTQADTYSAPKPVAVKPVKAVESKQVPEQPVSEPIQLAKPTKVVKAVKSQPAPTSENNTMLWWLLGGGIGLLGVIVLLMRRKQS